MPAMDDTIAAGIAGAAYSLFDCGFPVEFQLSFAVYIL